MDQLDRLTAAASTGCCGSTDWRGRLCPFHRGMEEAFALLVQVGPISQEEFVGRTAADEPLYGLGEDAYRMLADYRMLVDETGRQA